MPKGIKIWRWSLRKQHWHSHGPLPGHAPKVYAGNELDRGYNDGDWAIELEGTVPAKIVRVKASDVGPHGTIWYCKGPYNWVALASRSHGSRDHRPDFLGTLEGEHGEILIDLSHSGAHVDSGFLPYVVVDWKGRRELLQEETHAVAELLTVSQDSGPYGEISEADPDELLAMARRALEAERTAEFVDRVREKAMTGNGRQLLQTYAQLKPGDPVPKQVAQWLVQFAADLAPAPTPGTLAPVDYWRYIDDVKRAALGGLGEDGQVQDANAGTLSETGAQHLNAVGDLLAAGGALVEYVVQLKNMVQASGIPQGRTGDAQHNGVVNEAAATAGLDVAKLFPTVIGGVSNVLKLQQVATEGAQALHAIVPYVPFVSTVVGILSLARAWRKAVRARRRKALFKQLLQEGVNSNEMEGALAYAIGKTHRKARTQTATAVAAGVGSAGSLTLGITAVAGAANVWNPVGWTLLGIAAVGGAGIVGYKIYKRVTRKKRYEKRIAAGRPQTPGDLAAVLIGIAADPRHADRVTAMLMLESFGVEADSIHDSRLHETAKALIGRHLK